MMMDMEIANNDIEKVMSGPLTAGYNLVSGEMVRLGLLQMQFCKKELMVALGAMDELIQMNQVNYRP
jgi:hypothetical protein